MRQATAAAPRPESYPPKQHSPEPLLANGGASPVSIGGAVPPSSTMQRPSVPIEFPPDLVSELHQAVNSGGRYMIAVFSANEAGDIRLFRHASGGFLYDWWLRAAALFRKNIADSDPPVPLSSGADAE